MVLCTNSARDINYKINNILVDEYHSSQIQSAFRKNLVNFIQKVKDICNDTKTAISTVTASPNYLATIDVKIIPQQIPPINIYIEYDLEKTIERIKTDINQNTPVVLCTNSARNIYLIRDHNNTVEANFIIGTTMAQTLYELVVVKQNPQANLTIISSRGFEGFDIYYNNPHVYFLEDRANQHQTFYISNLYQAISRTRNGAKYIEYARQQMATKRQLYFKNPHTAVDKFIKRKDIATENKFTKQYQQYHQYIYNTIDDNGKFTLHKNNDAIDLEQEKFLYDDFPKQPAFNNFLKQRNISITISNNKQKRIKPKISENTKIKNLLQNQNIIEEFKVYDHDYKLNPEAQIRHAARAPLQFQYLKYLNTFIRRKNFNGQYSITPRQQTATKILSNQTYFITILKQLTKTYNKRSINKYGVKQSREYREEFQENSERTLCKLIIMFANDNIYTPANWIAHRNYNLITQIGIPELNLIAKIFDTTILEVDVKNCFVRILYALNKLPLTKNLYGTNKEKKLNILKALNKTHYNPEITRPLHKQKQYRIQRLQDLKVNQTVIEYIINNFFQAPYKSDLFNFVSFHEKKLISEIKNYIFDIDGHNGIIRRHDSLIIFNNKITLGFLNHYKFMNQDGWFNIQQEQSKTISNMEELPF